jgi:hypothetical protein
VVEDSRSQRELLVGLLRSDGMLIAGTANDGHEAVAAAMRLRPDVTIKRKKTPVYAIVREEIAPLWQKEKLFTDHSLLQLGLPPAHWERFRDYKALWEDDFHGIDPEVKERCLDLRKLLEGLLWFKRAADHRTRADVLIKTAPPERLRRAYAARQKSIEQHIEAADGFMAQAFDLMKTPMGAPVYMALHGLVTHYDVYLRDVHWMNVGWRVYDRIEGRDLPITIIIFDPGLASDMGAGHVREVSLAANGADELDPETVRCAIACELNETDDVWDAREEAFQNLAKNPRHYG